MRLKHCTVSTAKCHRHVGLYTSHGFGQRSSNFQRWFYIEHIGNRRSCRRRSQQSLLHEYRDGTQLNIVKRSALVMCKQINLLPESIRNTICQRFSAIIARIVLAQDFRIGNIRNLFGTWCINIHCGGFSAGLCWRARSMSLHHSGHCCTYAHLTCFCCYLSP